VGISPIGGGGEDEAPRLLAEVPLHAFATDERRALRGPYVFSSRDGRIRPFAFSSRAARSSTGLDGCGAGVGGLGALAAELVVAGSVGVLGVELDVDRRADVGGGR
jgi:hypothetical protein